VELYIDLGKERENENNTIFNRLLESREAIESAFGENLEWEPLEEKQACRIKKTIRIGGYRDEEKWAEIQRSMIDTMIRFERALRPYVAKLAP
jgi:hypothetical protein